MLLLVAVLALIKLSNVKCHDILIKCPLSYFVGFGCISHFSLLNIMAIPMSGYIHIAVLLKLS